MSEGAAPEILWPFGEPAEMRAADGVQVWCWSLHGADAMAEELCGELSADERARAGRFAFRRDWRRYVLAHAGMRRVLGAGVGRRGEEIVLGAGNDGKPYLAGDDGLVSGLCFNLTHSGNLAMLAVTWGMPVGVDVEEVRTMGATYPVEAFSVREQAYLRGLPPEDRAMGFYRCWTRKEALLKGVGIGLLGELGAFSVLPGWDRAEVSSGAGVGVAALGAWRVQELVPTVGFVGCLAVPGDGLAARCMRLRATS